MFVPVLFVAPVLFVLPVFLPKITPVGTTIVSSSSSSTPTVLITLTALDGHMVSLGPPAGTGGADIFLLLGTGAGFLGTFLSITYTFLSLLSCQILCKR